MNLKEIRDDVRSLIIEPTPGFRSNVELNRWINQAHQELGQLYRVEDLGVVGVSANQTFTPLPDNLLVFKGAWDSDGGNIPIIPTGSGTDLTSRSGNGSFRMFRHGENFALVPAPEQNTSIRVFYERRPKGLLKDSDEPEIPTPYHRYLVSYATMRALSKDEDYEAASVYANEYEQAKALISTHKTQVPASMNIILDLVQTGILNPAEAAEWLNIPLKDKVWNRVEVEDKALRLLEADVISRSDLIENTVFPDREEIEKSLETTSGDLAQLPSMWEDDIDG
jgi:hypothetical protein